jgi:non-specific serine/threonine protein kinase
VVAQICARLDGIPLAIELAASRVGALPVEAIAGRLDDRFRLLTAGPRTALPWQQTLRAALDWSHELLSPPEQALLRRLAVFAGGWTLEAAEGICADEEVTRWDVLDLLSALVNKSLLLLEEEQTSPRYRMLETVRAYAGERLATAGEEKMVRDRHLAWSVALAEEAEPQLTGPEEGAWLGRLEIEHDNLRAALTWAREQGVVQGGLRLASALQPFWRMRGYLSEGRGWLEATLAAGSEAPAALRAKASQLTGVLAAMQTDYGRAAVLYEESLALYREQGDKRGIAQALQNVAYVAYWQTEYARAVTLTQEALGLYRELRDKRGIAGTLRDLGWCARVQPDAHLDVVALGEEALALYRELGDKSGSADALLMLAYDAYRMRDHARSEALYQETLALRREMGDMVGVAAALAGWVMVVYRLGDYKRAQTLLREGLLVSRDTGFKQIEFEDLEIAAWVAAALGQPRRAAQLAGAAAALAEASGAPPLPDLHSDHDQVLAAMRAALGDEGFATAWAEGRAMSLDQAISLALADTPATP